LKILERPLGDLTLVELKQHHDMRGFFSETFREEWMREIGIQNPLVQENRSRSAPSVLRGLHYQLAPPQGKLVSVLRGRIFDVAVDIRKGSSTFGRYYGAELSDQNGRMLWVPAGFAHGFCVLGDEPADVIYKVTGYYNAATEGGVRWNDPRVAINWPVKNPILSQKDQILPEISAIEL
jgi:dTDP-4-dehydrorhamnose 3,5-epimerase